MEWPYRKKAIHCILDSAIIPEDSGTVVFHFPSTGSIVTTYRESNEMLVIVRLWGVVGSFFRGMEFQICSKWDAKFCSEDRYSEQCSEIERCRNRVIHHSKMWKTNRIYIDGFWLGDWSDTYNVFREEYGDPQRLNSRLRTYFDGHGIARFEEFFDELRGYDIFGTYSSEIGNLFTVFRVKPYGKISDLFYEARDGTTFRSTVGQIEISTIIVANHSQFAIELALENI